MRTCMGGEVTTQLTNGIGTIEFFHPKGNSLPLALLSELEEAIKAAAQNPDVRVIILRSKGDGAFCAGASFDELLTLSHQQQAEEFFSGFGRIISALQTAPKFVVGRVHGKTVGGGVGLVAACDYVLATHNASIKLSELSLGFGPFVIAPVVIKKIGIGAFSSLTLRPTQWKHPEWTYQMGLFNELHHSIEELDAALLMLSKELASYSPQATAEIKKLIWDGYVDTSETLQGRAQISARLSLSKETREILSSFRK